MKYRTEQEEFWAGEFGREYMSRNTADQFLASDVALFSRILGRTDGPSSVIELGANMGLNLEAIQSLLPNAELSAVEINASACDALRKRLPRVSVQHTSILEMELTEKFDVVLTKGVLIHINPDELGQVYDTIDRLARRYVVISEYYNPSPVSISYRGHSDRLFKRDFAGEFLDRHSGYEVVDYGFVWRRDPLFPQDDTTWFLLRRVDQA